MHRNIVDLRGQRFGNLTVLELTNLKTERKRNTVWLCKCDCGNLCYKTAADLRDTRRKTWSCGCLNRGHRQFPNRFVPKPELTGHARVRAEFADALMRYYAGSPYEDVMRQGISAVLESLNAK